MHWQRIHFMTIEKIQGTILDFWIFKALGVHLSTNNDNWGSSHEATELSDEN